MAAKVVSCFHEREIRGGGRCSLVGSSAPGACRGLLWTFSGPLAVWSEEKSAGGRWERTYEVAGCWLNLSARECAVYHCW